MAMFAQQAKTYSWILVSFLLVLVSGCDESATVENNDSNDHGVTLSIKRSKSFDIELGETVALKGSGLRLIFSAVKNDSRCPSDVVCVTEGIAEIMITLVSEENQPVEYAFSIPGLVGSPYISNDVVRIGDLDIRLIALDPYPEASRRDDAIYRATFQKVD